MNGDWPQLGSGFRGGDNSWGPPHKYGRTADQVDSNNRRQVIFNSLFGAAVLTVIPAFAVDSLWWVAGPVLAAFVLFNLFDFLDPV